MSISKTIGKDLSRNNISIQQSTAEQLDNIAQDTGESRNWKSFDTDLHAEKNKKKL
jgi:hypothetical protein